MCVFVSLSCCCCCCCFCHENVDTLMKENNLICIYQMRKSNKCYLQYKIPNNTILPMQTPGTQRSHLVIQMNECVCVRWLLHLNNKHSFQKLFRNSFFLISSHFPSVALYLCSRVLPLPPFCQDWIFLQRWKEKRNK